MCGREIGKLFLYSAWVDRGSSLGSCNEHGEQAQFVHKTPLFLFPRLPVICIDARHAKAALALQINKSDRNDAVSLARIGCPS